MKIIIPMSGTGSRFIEAGYKTIKPLIEIDGMPMIRHVVNMFPGEEKDFIFVCNKEHLNSTNLKAVLSEIKPTGRIVGINGHKYGPVYAVLQAEDLIADDEDVVVNYCDFSVCWDYDKFKKWVRSSLYDGCLTAYRGFHPHLLGNGLYAGIRADEYNNMLEIREKHCFTDDKRDSFHSCGTYYFKKGAHVKKYFKLLMDKDINTNGEYYVSMAYQLMKEDGLKIFVYEVKHFLQWGTPQDLDEYLYWSEYFKDKILLS